MAKENKPQQSSKGRNKFKTVLWDYYLTNREIGNDYRKENEKNKEQKQKWEGNEKLYLAIIVIGIIILIIKYTIF